MGIRHSSRRSAVEHTKMQRAFPGLDVAEPLLPFINGIARAAIQVGNSAPSIRIIP